MSEKTVLTHSQFANLVLSGKGAPFVAARTITNVSKSKAKSAPVVTRESVIGARTGWNYANTVNARLEREGKEKTFKAKPRTWGKPIMRASGAVSGLITHKEKLYITLEVLKSYKTEKFFLDGKPATREEVEPFMREKAPAPATQSAVEKKTYPKDYKFDSIREISYNGQKIELVTG